MSGRDGYKRPLLRRAERRKEGKLALQALPFFRYECQGETDMKGSSCNKHSAEWRGNLHFKRCLSSDTMGGREGGGGRIEPTYIVCLDLSYPQHIEDRVAHHLRHIERYRVRKGRANSRRRAYSQHVLRIYAQSKRLCYKEGGVHEARKEGQRTLPNMVCLRFRSSVRSSVMKN